MNQYNTDVGDSRWHQVVIGNGEDVLGWAPSVALVGVPNVTITVSLGSASVSAITVTVMAPVVFPAAIVSGLALMV
ncbi:MAG: hypothetical protein U1E90_05990 [Burkholderiaceae bacterium]